MTGLSKEGEEGGEIKVLGADGWTQGLEGCTRGPVDLKSNILLTKSLKNLEEKAISYD